jgi:outer membrane protein assembly factor BamB
MAETQKMIRSIRLILAMAVLFPVIAGFPSGVALQAEDISETDLSTAKVHPRWQSQAVMNSSRDRLSFFTADVDNIYIQSSAGVVTALNADTGRKLWASQIGLNDESSLAAVSNDDVLLITTGPVIHAVNKFTGNELFKFRLPGQPSTPPAVDNGSLYVPMLDGTVAGMSLRTLEHQERFGTLPPGVARAVAWRFVSGDPVSFSPIAGTDSIAIATDKGNFHSINSQGIQAGKSIFQLLLKSPVVAPMTLYPGPAGDTVLVATEDHRLHSIGFSKSGKINWTYPLTSTISAAMIVVGDDAFVITERTGLTKFSLSGGVPVKIPDNGKQWNVPNIEQMVAVSQDYVYAMDITNRLLKINRASAELEHHVTLNDHTFRLSNGLTDRIFLATASGTVVCLAEDGSDFATYHQRPGRQPLMPELQDKPDDSEPTTEETPDTESDSVSSESDSDSAPSP